MEAILKLAATNEVPATKQAPGFFGEKFNVLIVVLLASFATFPLFQPYFFASSDGLFHLYRLMEYDQLIRQGIWYPRWASDFFYGLGFPLFNFYAPLTYYLGVLIHLTGLGYLDSARVLAAITMAASGIGAYLYARSLLSQLSSILVAAVYMFVPYHLVNLYFRGDLAEYVAYLWFPFILWALGQLLQYHMWRHFFIAVGCFAALVLTHNLSAMLFSGFLVPYSIGLLFRLRIAGPMRLRSVIAPLLLLGSVALSAVALTAFFWLPAFVEKSLLDFDRLLFHYDFHEYFPTFDQLFSLDLIHRYGTPFAGSEVYGFRLGLLQSLFLVAGLLLLLLGWRRLAAALRVEAAVSVVVTVLSLFLIFPISLALWEQLPLLNLTQTSWRFLAFIALPSALLAGLIVEPLVHRQRMLAVSVLVPLVILSSVAGFSPILSNVKEADISARGSMLFELTYGAIGTSAAAEYLPKWVKQRPNTSPIAMSAILGEENGPLAGHASAGIVVEELDGSPYQRSFQLKAEKAGSFVPNLLYFPGWSAYLDDKPLETQIDDPTGLLKIAVPPGEHRLELKFEETDLRRGSDLVSFAALLGLLLLLVFHLRLPLFKRKASPKSDRPRSGSHSARQRSAYFLPVGILLLLSAGWLLAKVAYDTAYAVPVRHWLPLSVNLDHEVAIEGYDLMGVESTRGVEVQATSGEALQLRLFWHGLGSDPAKRFRPFARLTNTFDQTWAYTESSVEYQSLRTAAEAVATDLHLALPSATPPGVYEIEVGFFSSDANRVLRTREVLVSPLMPGNKGPRIGPVVVKRAAPAAASFQFSHPVPGSAISEPHNFGDGLWLVSLSIASGEHPGTGKPGDPLRAAPNGARESRAGDALHLEMLWQAIGKPAIDWTITARLADANQDFWTIRNSQPADGTYPTSYWLSDEVVRDRLRISVPPETPPGHYELQLEVVAPSGPLSILDRTGTPIGPTLRLGGVSLLPSATIADTKSVKMQRQAAKLIFDGLDIAAYSLGRPEMQPGDQLKVDLLWQATKKMERDLLARVSIVDGVANVYATHTQRPVGDSYPSRDWREREVLRGQYNLTLQASAPPGAAVVRVELLDKTSGEILGLLDLGSVHVLPRSRAFAADPERALSKIFDGKIRMLGFDLALGSRRLVDMVPSLNAGDTLTLGVHWQAIAEMNVSYTVFAQVLNEAGKLVAQHDAPPQDGRAPTTGWIQGEVVVDRHNIVLPPDLPEGDYTIIAGLYDAISGKRLSVSDGGDYARLTALRVNSPRR